MEIIFESSRVYLALSHAHGDRSSGVGMSLRDQLSNYKAATKRHLQPFPRHFRPVSHSPRDEVSVVCPRISLTKASIRRGRRMDVQQRCKQLVYSVAYPITKLATMKTPGRALNLIQPITAHPPSARRG